MSDKLTINQLEVTRHVKIHTDSFGLDIHASNACLGVWMTEKGAPAGTGGIGMVCQRGCSPYFALWPKPEYWKGAKQQLPLALSAHGLQVPHPDGTVTTLSLEQLSVLAKSLAT